MRKKNTSKSLTKFFCMVWIILIGISSLGFGQNQNLGKSGLMVNHDTQKGTLSIFRSGEKNPILVHNAREGVRPYTHPIVSPDGEGILTEYRPKHHLHQTGLYWGLKLVNGRDYFMNWEEDYWQRVSAKILKATGAEVKWETVYNLLNEKGKPILTETQIWSMKEMEGRYILDLEWRGKAKTQITLGEFYVGGLFLRMPWDKETKGEVINSMGQRNSEAEGQRAIWADVGMQVEGREDMAHIAIMDHPENRAFPTPWRVDNELGVGPSIQILGDWKIDEGKTEIIRYRLVVYTGEINQDELTQVWSEFVCKE